MKGLPLKLHTSKRLRIRTGGLRDYDALSRFHYLAARPATAARVLVLEDHTPTPADRYLGRRARGRIVGVLVESYPTLRCRARERALRARLTKSGGPGDGPWRGRQRERARELNREMRCISRVIVHPQWRGLGLGVGLVRYALSSAATRYTEALAVMGRVHPLFELAGMRACPASDREGPVYYLYAR